MTLNKNGFYEPLLEEDDKCINCGLCLDVCAFNHKERALENTDVHSWAAWSNDETVRQKCSSGGVGFEIGKQLIKKGYKAVGCRYNVSQQRAEHYIATTVEEFVQSIGSKYIQSYTADAFKKIDKKHEKYLVTGTPCQIDSFRRMINKFHCEENFILMDFFCHSVPSMWAWKAYMKMLEPKIGKVTYASWRNKFNYGWHDNWLMGVDGEKTSKPIDWHESYDVLIREKKSFIQSRLSQGDMFYRLFLGDLCLGTQCEHHCKYKYDKSSADIRIGDLWGKTYASDEKGTSALVSFTPVGKRVVDELKNVTLIEHDFKTVAEGQQKENPKRRTFTKFVKWYLKRNYPIDTFFFKLILKCQKLISRNRRRLNRLNTIIVKWG